MTDAYQIIAVCSCSLKDAEAAGRAYAKLDDKNRNLVRALCQKNGIARRRVAAPSSLARAAGALTCRPRFSSSA